MVKEVVNNSSSTGNKRMVGVCIDAPYGGEISFSRYSGKRYSEVVEIVDAPAELHLSRSFFIGLEAEV
jgi:hypothetical protein